MGMPTTSRQFNSYGPIALIPFLLGPTAVSLLLNGLLYGKVGLRGLLSKLIKWRISIIWYLISVLTIPVLLSVILLILSRFSSDFIPEIITEDNKLNLVLTGVLTGLLGGGLFEEIGWTGFATPELRGKNSVVKAGLIIGFFWGLWHFLPVYWGSGNSKGEIDWILFLPGLFSHYAVLIPYRVMIVWLYNQTQSLIPAILGHASLTTFILFILNISESGLPVFIYYLCVAVALWIIVVVINKYDKKKF
jgi:membrane protease YdiL (CAAX protease family)